jgi:hypothetical protein
MPDAQQEVAKLDRQLDSTRLDLPSDCRRACERPNEDVWLWNAENRQADDIQCIYPFGTYILQAICHRKGTEEKDSLDKVSRIASFISSRSSSLGDDEASPEFSPNRSKIASLYNLVTLEYETAFSRSTATGSCWMAFLERPLSRRDRTALLCSIWSIPAIWNTLVSLVSLVVFQPFLSRICCLSFFHGLWRFDSLSDIWCSNRECGLTIPRPKAHEVMGHSIHPEELFSQSFDVDCNFQDRCAHNAAHLDEDARISSPFLSKRGISIVVVTWFADNRGNETWHSILPPFHTTLHKQLDFL